MGNILHSHQRFSGGIGEPAFYSQSSMEEFDPDKEKTNKFHNLSRLKTRGGYLMNKTFKVLFTMFLFAVFVTAFTTAAFSEILNQHDSLILAQASSGGGTPKAKGQLPDTEAGKKMKAAMEKYKNDPLFQQLLQEERKIRQDAGSSRKNKMDEQNAKITKINDKYQPKIDAAKTETEKQALRKEMQGQISTMMQAYKKEANAKRIEMQTKNSELEKKYGAKFPDYFTAKNEMIREMQGRMKKGGNSGNKNGSKSGNKPGSKSGGMGQGQGGNDPNRQKMMSISRKYQNDPDFKKMTEEVRAARDDMRSQMENVGENRSERRRLMQNFQAKMQDIEKRYGSKFPDYFKALEEMRKNRQGGQGGGGGFKGGKGPQQ